MRSSDVFLYENSNITPSDEANFYVGVAFANLVLNVQHCRARATETCIGWMCCGHLSSCCNPNLLCDICCKFGIRNFNVDAFLKVL